MPITSGGVVNYNQKFIDTAEHIDTFIENRNRKHPSLWFDRIGKAPLTMYEGLVRKSNIFHGSLGEQAGLNNWDRIQLSSGPSEGDSGFDACNYDPKTFNYAWESRQYTGYRASWQSEPICVNDIVYLEQGKQQAMMIAGTMAYITMSVWENWNRENYVKTAAEGGNAFVLSDAGLDYSATPDGRFYYDPFAVDSDDDTYLLFSSDLEVSTLNWTFFDWWQDYLGDECPEAAIAAKSGLPVFGLILHLRDFDRMVMQNQELREDVRYAKSEILLDDYRTFTEFRGWALIHDNRQMRFKIESIVTDPVHEGTTLTGNFVKAKRVKPMQEGRQVTIGNVPEANPDYNYSELAVGVVFMNEVMTNLIPSLVGDLGMGMKFGPCPGYDGKFMWINEYDRELNPLREVGYFFARFQAFPKPQLFSNQAIVFLYRRCPQTIATICARLDDGTHLGDEGVVPNGVVQSAGTYDPDTETITVTLDNILGCGAGSQVTVTGASAGGIIADASLAPTYVLAFATDESTVTFAGATVECAGTQV